MPAVDDFLGSSMMIGSSLGSLVELYTFEDDVFGVVELDLLKILVDDTNVDNKQMVLVSEMGRMNFNETICKLTCQV
jgi:hypothetical protein